MQGYETFEWKMHAVAPFTARIVVGDLNVSRLTWDLTSHPARALLKEYVHPALTISRNKTDASEVYNAS